MNGDTESWVYVVAGFIGLVAIKILWQIFTTPNRVIDLEVGADTPVKSKPGTTKPTKETSEADWSVGFDGGIQKSSGTQEQTNAFNNSTLAIHFDSQLFMHFFDSHAVSNSESNMERAHREVFFWRHNEEFPKMSLPQEFASMNRLYFQVIKESDSIAFSFGTVIPWFGQPGGGTKYVFSHAGNDLPIQDALKNGLIEYVVIRDVVSEGLGILFDRENNFIWVDTDQVQFVQGKIFQNGREIDYATAFSIGALLILGKPNKT